MKKIHTSLIAGMAIAAIVAPAYAADMPAPMVFKAPVKEFSGWYLRGDIGMTNQKVKSIDNVLFDPSVQVVHKEFESGMLFGAGLGYQFNDWFRVDVTGEYRGKTAFRGFDFYPGGANDYYGDKSEWLFLANAYVDLGTWWCVTPFIGAGIGYSKNTISNFRDVNVPNNGIAYANNNSQWEMAWALHAGLAYKVNKNFTAELSYRYVNLGDFQSGDIIAYDGTNNVNNPMLFKDVTSQDIRLSLRWALGASDYTPAAQPFYAPPPPPPAYTPAPAPVYSPPPPLMRKG
ncbi:outer membrane protein [Pseudorhodoplanes sinuspersici]|uniref:Cell envelope biogenesis protein OmpA n=1 Tax=Pseudorhodoplanes sinuspersici TaxID=1235591 RepID=A0A1W6ZYR8_9HYPH|nr:outer membrane beta-barrel protein [Pseudorhodoplanes sinuspersici]ARQ02547.1 cell envelope biogenesis protein OmpA [Pseudorhodoplanes sinuspersici]RKE74395.1 opacity protein-like surface antigen [Pseudorhodoplanes sinuspersici]